VVGVANDCRPRVRHAPATNHLIFRHRYANATTTRLRLDSHHGGGPLAGQTPKRAITFDDFLAVRAVTDPQISPDGHSVLYAVRVADLGANRRGTKTFVVL